MDAVAVASGDKSSPQKKNPSPQKSKSSNIRKSLDHVSEADEFREATPAKNKKR